MQTQNYLTICAIFRNEANWLAEWVEYHLLTGVDKFLLYDHRSSDDWQSVLAPYIQEGVVEVIPWSHESEWIQLAQPRAYKDAIRRLKEKSTWVAFMDIDEFLVPKNDENLPAILSGLEEYGGVLVNWRIFGTGGVKRLAPGELLIERLTRCARLNGAKSHVVKSIVRPGRVVDIRSAHYCCYQKGYYAVDTSGQRIQQGRYNRVARDRLIMNHYIIRTKEWAYGEKLKRRWRPPTSVWYLDYAGSRHTDHTIQKFVPELRRRLTTRYQGAEIQ
jgi:Glycosyltransferase family 92